MAGVFITRGMTVVVPAGGLALSLDDKGKLSGSATTRVRFEVCPTWLGLAVQHLEIAKANQARRRAAWVGTDDSAKAEALEREFEASMQAIMAAAIAWDAFYAVISDRIKVLPELVAKWRKKRTPRYAQVAEVLRKAFTLKTKSFQDLRQNLGAIYRLRDRAVHPTGKIAEPVYHPELEIGAEWRFVDFRYETAAVVVKETLRLMSELVTSEQPNNTEVKKYADEFRPALHSLQQSPR
jgi:hypothetical protein